MSLWVKTTLINAEDNVIFHQDEQFYEAWTDHRGKLFRLLQQEYGRCEGKVYRDRPKRFDGPDNPIPCGYVFRKKQEYADSWRNLSRPDCYLQETWVEIQEREDEEF